MCAAVCYTEYHSGKQHHSISVEYNCYIHVGFKYEETKKLMKEFKQWPFHLVYVSNSSAQLNHREPIYYSNYICHFVCIYNVRNEVFSHASKLNSEVISSKRLEKLPPRKF